MCLKNTEFQEYQYFMQSLFLTISSISSLFIPNWLPFVSLKRSWSLLPYFSLKLQSKSYCVKDSTVNIPLKLFIRSKLLNKFRRFINPRDNCFSEGTPSFLHTASSPGEQTSSLSTQPSISFIINVFALTA